MQVKLRDWHNAIVRVANVNKQQLEVIKAIDNDIDNESLYEQLGEVEYTDDLARYVDAPMFDGYYSH